MLRSLSIIICITLTQLTYSQDSNSADNKSTPEFLTIESNWAEEQLAQMTLDEKIGQLFMVAAYSGKDEAHFKEIDELITQYHIGGLIFFKGTPIKQAKLTNRFQKNAKIPLFIAIDGEWGLSMRLDSTVSYGRQMMLGALPDSSLIYEMGRQIGQACNELGIHINFAPVIDVNNNPKNPVINNRSFGEVKELVAKFGMMYMKGMQDYNVLACGKHFPGHGDTDTDSHKDLPIILHEYGRLDSIELYPFKELIEEKLASIMVAHLYIPELDDTENQASTLSPKIINGLLRDSLGFEGLVFTDALNMKGVTKFYEPGEVDVKAIMAGNDVLLFPLNVPVAVNKIKEAISSGEITEEEIDEKCLRILKAKQWAGLDEYKPIETKGLYERLNPVEAEVLNRQIAKRSLTLVQNQDNALPLQGFDTISTVYLNIGGTKTNKFYSTMNFYSEFPMIQIPRSLSQAEETALLEELEKYDRIIIGFHRTNNSPKRNFGITRQMIGVHEILSKRQDVITVIFGNPICP